MTQSESDPNADRPSMPMAPRYEAPPVAVEQVERPGAVTRAVQLMYVGAALSVVSLVVAWATKSQLRDKLAASGTTMTPAQLDTAVTASLVFATVLGLVGVGLWLWMAAANGAGKSWARIVATVLGGLNVVSTLIGLTQATGLTVVLSLISLVLAVVILVLLWRPTSSAYYRARSARVA